jgi:hypothetical protein
MQENAVEGHPTIPPGWIPWTVKRRVFVEDRKVDLRFAGERAQWDDMEHQARRLRERNRRAIVGDIDDPVAWGSSRRTSIAVQIRPGV